MRAVALSVVLLLAGCGTTEAPDRAAGSQLGVRFLAEGSDDGFARASEPRELVFPRDHGSHPDYRTEWWYFTGNLHEAGGRHYGFELTFFRIALAAAAPERESAWGASEIWMAHFAVTDTAAQRFHAFERFARGALGLAGATAEPFRVWTERWSVAGEADAQSATLVLDAREGDVGLELSLTAEKPAVAHGEGGIDLKGPEAGNASYYYSVPRLAARGEVTVGGRRAAVSGLAWMDREWSTSALSPGLSGWDWFALHLSDGRDLMFYRLRRTDGGASPFSAGSLIDRSGRRRALTVDDVQLTPTRFWTSRRSGAAYPVAWRLAVLDEGIELAIEPRLEDQELDVTVRYWEGAVTARDTRGNITAEGYLELAGY